MHNLLILSEEAETYTRLLQEYNLPELRLNPFRKAEDADIILGEPPIIATILSNAPALKWVQSVYAGVDALMTPGLRRNYLLTGVKGVFGPMMSEYVFGYILALERHFFETKANQQKSDWHPIPYRQLEGRILGICGLGNIGRHIARTAKHFDMQVWGYKTSPAEVPGVDHLFTPERFTQFLSEPDYIVITLPHTLATHHLFNESAFAAMNKTAVLINVGRGPIVDQQALIQALNSGKPRLAVLDVFEKEPLPKADPLWDHPRVIFTPHTAAHSFPEEIVKIFVENYRHLTAGRLLRFCVDFDKGY